MDTNECVCQQCRKMCPEGYSSTPRVPLLHTRNLYVFFVYVFCVFLNNKRILMPHID